MFIQVMPKMFLEADAGGGTGGEGGDNGGATPPAGDGGSSGGTGGEGGGGSSGDGGAGSGKPQLPWLPNASDDEVAFAQSKGWDKGDLAPVDQVFRSYHNLQKLFGADKAGSTVMVPGEGADQATKDAFYNKIGRPESPDGYEAKEFAGLNESQEKDLKEFAHKNGLTEKQLSAFKEWNDQQAETYKQELETDVKVEFAKQEASLKQEWGAAYEQKMAEAKVAAAKLNLDTNQVNAMQMALGYDGVMKLIAQLGTGMGESTFVNGDGGRSGGNSNVMTPEAARAELNRLGDNKDFMEAWQDKMHPKHKEMVERKSQLSRWASGQA